MAIRLDSPVSASNFIFSKQTYISPTDVRFDAPDAIGGTYILDIQDDPGPDPIEGAQGAAMYNHLRNLGMY
jgi:hypothetical protein